MTRQTSNKHMSVCPSFTVSRRFLIQRELNKSQLLYMQVYLYISIIMASIQTRSLASTSGSVHGCELGPEWRHADISSRHSSYLFCSFHNLPHTTRRHLLHSNKPHSSSSHFQSAVALVFTLAWLSGRPDHHILELWQGATSIYVYYCPIFVQFYADCLQ